LRMSGEMSLRLFLLLIYYWRPPAYVNVISLDAGLHRHDDGQIFEGFYYAYLIASGLTGEPTAPVIGNAGATNRNS